MSQHDTSSSEDTGSGGKVVFTTLPYDEILIKLEYSNVFSAKHTVSQTSERRTLWANTFPPREAIEESLRVL